MARECFEIEFKRRFDEDVDDIAELRGFACLTMSDLNDIFAALQDAFRKQKTTGEFGIVPRRAHGDGDTFASDTDFERFLPCEPIFVGTGGLSGTKPRDVGSNEQFLG